MTAAVRRLPVRGVFVRLSPEEHERIASAARLVNMTPEDMVRMLLTARELDVYAAAATAYFDAPEDADRAPLREAFDRALERVGRLVAGVLRPRLGGS